jgi:hypothetical protein
MENRIYPEAEGFGKLKHPVHGNQAPELHSN